MQAEELTQSINKLNNLKCKAIMTPESLDIEKDI